MEIEVGKKYHTPLFKNDEMSSYYFYAANKASESFVSSAVRMLLLSSGKFSLCAFNSDYKYLDSGHTRPPVLEKKGFDLFHFFRLRKRIL